MSDSHFWIDGLRFCFCGLRVTPDLLHSPMPTCPQCVDAIAINQAAVDALNAKVTPPDVQFRLWMESAALAPYLQRAVDSVRRPVGPLWDSLSHDDKVLWAERASAAILRCLDADEPLTPARHLHLVQKELE